MCGSLHFDEMELRHRGDLMSAIGVRGWQCDVMIQGHKNSM
jgi:hypothetical protein